MQAFTALVFTALFICQGALAFAPTPFRYVASKLNQVLPRIKSSVLLRMAATEAPPKVDTSDMGSTGLFTNSSPETRRVVPENASGKTQFKIVYVVLESQYQSALTKACNSINSGTEGVAVEAVGYLLEELRNPAVFKQFKEDVGSANIFIGSLIFVQELADKVSHYMLLRYYFKIR